MAQQHIDIFDLKKLRINQTKAQLEAQGKQKHKEVSSGQLAEFVPVRRSAVDAIRKTESNMIPELLELRHQRMMASHFTFFRGTAELMESDLKHQYQSHIPTIICGDAHTNNFGFFASPERQLLFGLNDFDEARIGNWESDLKRLLVSAILAGEDNGFDEKDLVDNVLPIITKTYRHAVKRANKKTVPELFYSSYEVHDLSDTIHSLGDDSHKLDEVLNKIIKKSQHSNSEEIVKKMGTINQYGHLIFQDNPPRARHLTDDRYQELVRGFDHYRENVREDVRILLANYHITDIIRYSVGVGSFGTRCYLVLLTAIDGSHLVLQIKEAQPLRYNMLSLGNQQVLDSSVRAGRRIVTAQRVLQSASDPFLAPTSFGGRSYYVRQFRDMKESINVNKLDLPSFTLYCRICALLLARAHYQSPTAPMIRGYLKGQKDLDEGLADWALKYSSQVAADYQEFAAYLKQQANN